MVDSLGTALGHLQRRLVAADAVARGRRWLLGSGLTLGTLALFARFVFGWSTGQAAWLLLGLLGVPLAAVLTARRRVLSPEAAATWLDTRAGGLGAIVAAVEVDDPRWRARCEAQLRAVPAPPSPDVAGVVRRGAGVAAYAAAALLVPVGELTPPAGPPPGLFESALARVEEKLDALQEVVSLPPEEQKELEDAAARLTEEARASQDPEATLEAAARLEQRLEERAQEALDSAQRAAEALADAASRSAAGLDASEELAAAAAALAEGRLDLDALAAKLPPGIDLGALGLGDGPTDGDGAQGDAPTPFDPAQLADLADALSELLAGELGALADAGLLSAGALRSLAELGGRQALDLAALLDGAPGDGGEGDGECDLCRDLPEGEPCPGGT
jgi:hypothetical protein